MYVVMPMMFMLVVTIASLITQIVPFIKVIPRFDLWIYS